MRRLLRNPIMESTLFSEGEMQQLDDDLARLLYMELRRLAGGFFRGERSGHTLQPTALVNEAWLRLHESPGEWENRSHFLGAAARAMRRILVEHARKRAALKRGGDFAHVTFDDLAVQTPDPGVDVLLLNDALDALSEHDGRLARVVELHFFAGCTFPEIAETLGLSEPTVRRDWAYARAWLHERITGSKA